MDDLFYASLEQIALQGPPGCPLGKLFALIERAPAAAGHPLSDVVKEALWGMLLHAEPDVTFVIPREGGAPEGHMAGSKPKKGKKAKKGEDDSEGDDEAADTERAGAVIHAKTLQPGASSELGSLQAAQQHGVHVVASRELQDDAIGLYDVKLTKHQLSNLQRKALGLVGAAGYAGILQNELCNSLGQDPRSFFYVIKNLEQRGLLVKRAAMVQGANVSHVNKGKVQTNLLHLARFAPALDRDMKYTDGTAIGHRSTMLALDSGSQPLGSGVLGMLDDAAHFRRICERLAGLEGRCARETEFKTVLGYQGTWGHRIWRRLKATLVKRGHLEEFVATVEARPVKVIRLLKGFAEDHSDNEESGEDEEGEGGAGAEGRGLLSSQVAELTIDRQLFRSILAAGPDGVTSLELDSRLAFNLKRGMLRLRELEKRFDVTAQMVNQGRSAMIRYTASEGLLATYGQDVAPLNPPGGWLGLVETAIEQGLEPGDPFPNLGMMAGVAQQSSALPLQAEAAVDAAVRPSSMEVVEDGVGAEAGAAQDAAEVPAPPVENGGPEPSLQQRAPMFIVSEPAPRPPSAASGGPDAGGGQGVFARQATLLFQKRVHWLIERVEQDGFVLQSALPRFFKECDEAEGVHNSSKPDRKTIARVVERAEATGRVQSLQVALPTVQGGLQTRSHTIVVKPGIETGPEFVDKVYHAHRTLSQRIRRDATGLAQKLHMSGIPIPQLQLPSLLPSRLAAQQQGTAGDENPEAAAAADNTSEHAAARVAAEPAAGYVDLRAQETHRRMSANGFVSAKLQRVKLLHQVALRAVGLAAGPRLKQQLHDEGPQPEVAEGQHEQQQQQQQQQEEEGLQQEQQETDVAPAMEASAELLAGPAQDASGPTAQAQAAAATAAGAADFLVSAVAGEGMGPSRLDVQTMAADDPRRRYLLTSQGLWDCLTVEQYVQIVGTSTDDTDAVRQLVATGKRLGGLTPEEQQQLFGLEPLYAHRPTQRLSSLLDLMMRMGLLSSVVPVGPRARFGLHGLEANTFVVRERVQFQEPGPRQLLGPLETGVQAGGQQPLRLTHSFDLSAHEGFLMYWARLQYAVVGSNRQGARLPLADPLRQCFPFDRATEVAFEKSWSTRRTMSTQQWAQLQAAVAHVRDPYLITAQACFDLARTLGIEYENVLAFVREQRSRTRKERLGGATLGLGRTAGIGARGKGLGGAAGLGGGRGRGGGGVARAPVTEAQAEARRKAAEGRHRRKLEALQRQHRAEGLAESALPMELPPRPTKRRPPSQGLLRVRPEADTHREKAERLALAQHAAAGTQGCAAAAAAAATAAAAAAVRDSRGTQRAAQRQLLPPNSESEEEEGELEPVEVDREALMTKPPPMRKKKWHPYEDRQLLCAWAGFLARQGPDKMLIWRKLRGRPTPFKAATLRNRMRELRKQEDTAPLVARIQEAAVSVYESSVEHEAEQLRMARQAEKAAAAAAEASLDKVELPPLPPSWPSSSQLGKRPAEEAAAAATLAGSGGGHQEGQAEQAGTGASDSMGVAAQEREEGELPAGVAAKRLRQLASEPLSGLEEAEEAMKLLGSLAPARDSEDRRALQEIAVLVERVVSLAPKRFSAQLQMPLQPLTAPRPARPAVVDGKASSGKRPGPKPGFRQLRSEVARLAGKVHAARPALRLGLAGGRELNLPPSMRPSPTIAALAELLKSLLLMGSEKGTLGPGPQRALLQRFSQEQLMEAFTLMHRLGLINPGGGRSSAMQLSDRFRARLQALGMPSDVFKQAAASKARLREEGRLDVLPAQPTPPGAASIPPATDGLDGGTVAAALDLLLHGQANLEPHGATASPQQPALPAPTLLEARQADLRQHGSLLAISIPVRITCEAQATSDQHPDVQPAQAMAGLREAAAQPNPAQVFYQPSLVAVSQAVRSGAEAAAAAALEAIVSPGSRPEVLLSAVLQSVRETGSEGLAEQDLERFATEQLAAGPSPAGEPMPERAGTFSRALQQYGLVRRIGRWDIAALVAAEHSQGLVAFPEPPSTDDSQPQDERIAGLLEAAGLPKQGQLQRCLDRPFRPWLDHQGQLNESMLEALVERTISIVMRHPGIPERLLVLELGAVSPFYARELLGLMEEHGMLRSQDISRLGGVSASASSKGGGALFACFKGAAQPQPSMSRCYFLTQESIR